MRWLPFLVVLVACRDPAPAPVVDAGEPEPSPSVSASGEPRHADAKPEAGVLVNPLCEGRFLTLFEPSCEVSDAEWAATIGPDPGVVVQEAKIVGLAGGNAPRTIEFSLTNKSVRPVLIAQRFDDRSLGKSFSVMAEAIGGQGIYELGPPRVNGQVSDAGAHLHSTRIKLLPGGRAIALLVIDFKPTERLDKPRVDGGTAAGARDAGAGDAGALATLEGNFNVHLGQLFTPAETGNPAKLQVSNGIAK